MDRSGTLRGSSERSEQVHLVGVDGRGMAALAGLLPGQGDEVTDSCFGPFSGLERLRDLGVRVHRGHGNVSIPRSARLLVRDANILEDHRHQLRASRFGIRQATRRDLIGDIRGRGAGIVAVGGRRAEASAAMIGWVLRHAGLDPSFLPATSSPQLGCGGNLGSGAHVVTEVDSDPTVSEIPGGNILLMLEDSGDGLSGLMAAIRRWEADSARGKYALYEAGEVNSAGVGRDISGVEVESLSLERGHDWWGADLREERGCYRFRAFHRGTFAAEIRLRTPGLRRVLEALAAVAICARLDVATGAIKEALEEFAGVSRGFESRGSYRGVTLVDDEAPGPTGAGEALRIARQVFGRRRLLAAFRPEAAGIVPPASSFADADSILMIDERGSPGGPIAGRLADEMEAAGSVVSRARDLDGAIRGLDRQLEPGDVLVTLGAGDVGTIADAFLRRLPGDRHA